MRGYMIIEVVALVRTERVERKLKRMKKIWMDAEERKRERYEERGKRERETRCVLVFKHPIQT